MIYQKKKRMSGKYMDELKYKFVVIIPTYNRFEKMKRAVLSVVNQTYSNWELFLVDDHSLNEEKEKKQQFLNELNDERIHYFYLEENKGHAVARNYGLSMIKDEIVWVKYFDDDDYMLENCLLDINDFLNKYPHIDVLTANYIEKMDDEERILCPNYKKISVYDGILNTCAICHSYALYKRIGGWDERLYRMADDDFFFKYINEGEYAYLNKTISVFHNTSNKDRVTNQCSNYKYCKIISEKYDYFKLNSCLIITDNVGDIYNENYNIESFLPFEVSNKMEKGYEWVVKYNPNDSLNDIFYHHYKTKEKVFKYGQSMFFKGI